jgi:hypothetical protein
LDFLGLSIGLISYHQKICCQIQEFWNKSIVFRRKYGKLVLVVFGVSTWQRAAIRELAPQEKEGAQTSSSPPRGGLVTQPVANFAVRQLYLQVAENRWPPTAFLLAIFRSVPDEGVGRLQKAVQGSISAAKEVQSAEAPEENVLDLLDRRAFLRLTRALFLDENIIPKSDTPLLKADRSRRNNRIRIHLAADFAEQIGKLKLAQASESQAEPDPAPRGSVPDSEPEIPAEPPETASEAEQPDLKVQNLGSQASGESTDPAPPTESARVPSGESFESAISDAAKAEEIQLSSEDAKKLNAARIINEITYADGAFSAFVDGSMVKISSQNGILDLSSCVNLKLLNIKNVPGLKGLKLPAECPNFGFLDISECNNLETITIPPLAHGVEINIQKCDNLKELTFAESSNEITALIIHECEHIETIGFPNRIIKYLRVVSCNSISSISVNENNTIETLDFSKLPKLAILDIGNCEKLEGLWVHDCASLDKIDLSGCPSVNTVSSNSTTTNIAFPEGFSTVINADGSGRKFKAILREAGVELQEDINLGNRGITIISDTARATEFFNHASTIGEVKYEDGIFTAIVDGKYKIEIPIHDGNTLDFSKCENLAEIHIENAPGIKAVILPNGNNKLKVIDFSHCKDLRIVDLSSLANLTKLNLNRCYNLNKLKLPPQGDSLEKLEIIECYKLGKLDLSDFANLADIQLNSCANLSELKFPSANNNLKKLRVEVVETVKKIDISACANIEEIYIDQCGDLAEITMGNNSKITKFTALLCEHLPSVDISRCENIRDIEVCGPTTIIAPQNPPNVIDATDSSDAVKQALHDAGAKLSEDPPAALFAVWPV